MRLHSPAITGSLTVSGSINIQGDSISTYKTDFYTGGLTPSHYFGRNTSNNAFPIATFNHAGGASFFIGKTKISGSINTTGSFGMIGISEASPTAPLHVYQDSANTAVAPTPGILIEQDGTGDAVLQFLLTGTKRWIAGIDNSDSDKFKIVHGVSDLGSNNVLHLDTSNNLTLFGNVSGSATSTGSFGAVEVGGIGHVGHLRLQDGANYHELKEDGGSLVVMDDNRNVHFEVTNGGDILPGSDNSFDLGSASKRWANLFVGDLELSNEGSGGNDVDGTEGKWTIQEGEENLYLLNRKNNKKYKFLLEEIE